MKLSNYPSVLFTSSTNSDGNMSIIKGNPIEAITNRKKFIESLRINLDQTICMSLTHGTDVISVDKKDLGKGIENLDTPIECDGLITNKKAVFLFLLTGDCIPTAFYDPQTNSIALIHASIHNLAKDIYKVTIDHFRKEFNSKPEDIVVQFGPSICPDCYKPLYLEKTPQKLHKYLTKQKENYSFDIWKLAKDQLMISGIQEENIYNLKICTYHSGNYFSHRQFVVENLPNDYRFATILGIKK